MRMGKDVTLNLERIEIGVYINSTLRHTIEPFCLLFFVDDMLCRDVGARCEAFERYRLV